jgi:hypothetical protein
MVEAQKSKEQDPKKKFADWEVGEDYEIIK